MTIIGLFEKIGTNAGAVVERFGGNEVLLEKFVKKMPQDPSYFSLREAIHKNDYEGIERAAHTLKGVTANLGFDVLSRKSAELVDAVRQENYEVLPSLFETLSEEYEKIIRCIETLD